MNEQIYYSKNIMSKIFIPTLLFLVFLFLLFALFSFSSFYNKIFCFVFLIVILTIAKNWFKNIFLITNIKLSRKRISVTYRNKEINEVYRLPNSIKKVDFLGSESKILLNLSNDKNQQFKLATWNFKEETKLASILVQIINYHNLKLKIRK